MNKMLKKTRRLLPDILCVALFAVIALVYFYPADIEGRRLNQHDNNAADGIGVEINQYRDRHNGETPRWTNSVFGGMPTYQISPSYDSTLTLSFIEKAYHLWLPDYVFYIFVSTAWYINEPESTSIRMAASSRTVSRD